MKYSHYNLNYYNLEEYARSDKIKVFFTEAKKWNTQENKPAALLVIRVYKKGKPLSFQRQTLNEPGNQPQTLLSCPLPIFGNRLLYLSPSPLSFCASNGISLPPHPFKTNKKITKKTL